MDPASYQPMLATPGREEQLRGPGWHYEVKWDGYRAMAHHPSDGSLVLASRGGINLLPAHPELAELDELLAGHDAVVDGEVVALGPDGRSDFEALQNHRSSTRGVHFMAFDLLRLDGTELLGLPYLARRELLEAVLDEGGERVHVPSTFGDDLDLALTASRSLQLEGLVAKRHDSPYLPGRRSEHWLKVKNVLTQDVVVIGWKAGTGGRQHGLGSLLLAVPDDDGRLVCAGSAGSGFTQQALAEMLTLLTPLQRTDNPGVLGVRPVEVRENTFVEPVLVGEVACTGWTAAGRLRHPVWRGLREHLTPAEVRRELPGG